MVSEATIGATDTWEDSDSVGAGRKVAGMERFRPQAVKGAIDKKTMMMETRRFILDLRQGRMLLFDYRVIRGLKQ
jgi:hypothetical protein